MQTSSCSNGLWVEGGITHLQMNLLRLREARWKSTAATTATTVTTIAIVTTTVTFVAIAIAITERGQMTEREHLGKVDQGDLVVLWDAVHPEQVVFLLQKRQ